MYLLKILSFLIHLQYYATEIYVDERLSSALSNKVDIDDLSGLISGQIDNQIQNQTSSLIEAIDEKWPSMVSMVNAEAKDLIDSRWPFIKDGLLKDV